VVCLVLGGSALAAALMHPFPGLVATTGKARLRHRARIVSDRAVVHRSQQRRRLRWAGPLLTPRCPELLSIQPHDRGGRFEPNAYGAALVDKGTLGGNAFDDILGRQHRIHPVTTLRRYCDKVLEESAA
jgi:hypothetical protein